MCSFESGQHVLGHGPRGASVKNSGGDRAVEKLEPGLERVGLAREFVAEHAEFAPCRADPVLQLCTVVIAEAEFSAEVLDVRVEA